jgi:glycosyltransferase A (GT-A) superfamily protein (DUF2064 family)
MSDQPVCRVCGLFLSARGCEPGDCKTSVVEDVATIVSGKFGPVVSPLAVRVVQAAPAMLDLLRHADNTDADDSVADALDALIERNNGGDEDDLVRATVNVSAFLGKARAIFDRIDKATKETPCDEQR